jgi:hypothetical protein
MTPDMLKIYPTRQEPCECISVRERDWVALIIDDPNGPLLATLGTVCGWDDDRSKVAIQTDDSGEAFWIPLNLVRSAYLVDGPVMTDVYWDPQRA